MNATIGAMPAPSDSVAPASAASTLPPPPQQSSDVMHALHRIALGPTGAKHYLPHFALFDALDRTRTTWNWAAAGPSLGWMVYRGLWRQALLYALVVPAIALLWLGVLRPLLGLAPPFEAALALAWMLLSSAVPGLWGDSWLYRQISDRTEQALESATNLAQAQTILQKQAPTMRRLWAVVAAYLLALGAAVALLFVLGAPAQDTLTSSTPPVMADAALLPASASLTPASASASEALPLPDTPSPAASAPDSSLGDTSSALLAATPALAAAALATPQETSASAALPAPAAPALAAASTTTTQITSAPPVVSTARSPVAAASAGASDAVPGTTNTKKSSKRSAEATNKSTGKKTAKATQKEPTASARASRAKDKANSTKEARSKDKATTKARTGSAAAKTSQATPARKDTSKAATVSSTLVGQRYYVNAGVYASADNASRAQQKLQRAGLPVVVQQVTTNRGDRSRVRAGPFATAAEAKTAAQRIRGLGLEAVVYHHR